MYNGTDHCRLKEPVIMTIPPCFSFLKKKFAFSWPLRQGALFLLLRPLSSLPGTAEPEKELPPLLKVHEAEIAIGLLQRGRPSPARFLCTAAETSCKDCRRNTGKTGTAKGRAAAKDGYGPYHFRSRGLHPWNG